MLILKALKQQSEIREQELKMKAQAIRAAKLNAKVIERQRRNTWPK